MPSPDLQQHAAGKVGKRLPLLLLALLASLSTACFKSPTAPDCVTYPRHEVKQTLSINNRLVFVTVVAPKTTVCPAP